MEHFSGRGFFWIGAIIESIKSQCYQESIPIDGDVPIYNLSASLNDETREKAARYLLTVVEQCRSIGLEGTSETAEDIRERLMSHRPITNYQWLIDQMLGLRKSFEREAKKYVFLYVSPDVAKKFFPNNDRPYAFGEVVFKKFTSAQFDIHEASICMGCGRATAAVFHLMRVMEIGLAALGKKFGVSLVHTNWAPAIEEIESKIRNSHKDPAWKALPDYKEQQEFYAQAATHFGILKDAWRNYTMHVRGKYTEQEAERIFENVKAFMQKLAERLEE